MLASSLLLLLTLGTADCAFPPSLRYPLPVAGNAILETTAACDVASFNATVTLQYPFKGLLFSKDFSQECHVTGNASNVLSISLPTSGCGLRLGSRPRRDGSAQMFYSVVLVVQQDRHLRQIADQERYLECLVEDDAFAIRSRPMEETVRESFAQVQPKIGRRAGRMKKLPLDEDDDEHEQNGNTADDHDDGYEGNGDEEDGSSETDEEIAEEELAEALAAARAWMELSSEEGGSGTLQVGQPATLVVKSTLPAGIGWKVVDCLAHDGQGDSSQKLLDEEGCPIDELLLPIPQPGPIQPISLMKHQEAVSVFPAFKFPDRDRLHLSCCLELCRSSCREVDCANRNASDNRLARTLGKGETGEVLDRLQVFNSVEVLAPSIDDPRSGEKVMRLGQDTFPFEGLPGDRTFCVSPDKIALTFCVLGVVFLLAVVIAACALCRARRNHTEAPFYPRSLFSSSSGSGYLSGSKLLLRESPCVSQASRGTPYGRIL